MNILNVLESRVFSYLYMYVSLLPSNLLKIHLRVKVVVILSIVNENFIQTTPFIHSTSIGGIIGSSDGSMSISAFKKK